MAEQNVIDISTFLPLSSDTRIGKGGGAGGGPNVDAETKNYLDAKMDSVKAQNDARFSEVLSGINGMAEKVSHLEPVSVWKIGSIVAAGVVALVGILGIMADRFDGGLAASGLVNAFQKTQTERDASQDAKLDKIIGKLDIIAVPPTLPKP